MANKNPDAPKKGSDATRNDYIAAFIAANGSRPSFTLDYEAGWWCIRYQDDARPSRYRESVLLEMAERLRASAAERQRRSEIGKAPSTC